MKYAFIQQHQPQFPVVLMCRVLEVCTSAYYAWRSRRLSAHQQRDQELGELIQGIYDQSCRRYGSPRVYHELRALGVRCSEKRVARLMQERGLAAQKPRRFIATTDSGHSLPVATNVLDRAYQVEMVANVNRAWAGDITYIATAQGWLSLKAGFTWQ